MASDFDDSTGIKQHAALSPSDADESTTIDSILDRIREKTPALPYIVSVPSGIPYKSAKTQYDFRESTWTPEEKHLEYSSYLFRNTASDGSILHLEAQGIPEDISVHNTPRPDSRSVTDPTAPSTPLVGSKKKVSLADYKRRAKEKTSTPAQTSDHISDADPSSKLTSALEMSHVKADQQSNTKSTQFVRPTKSSTSKLQNLDGLPQPRSEASLSERLSQTKDEKTSRPEQGSSSPALDQSSNDRSAHTKTKLAKNMASARAAVAPHAKATRPDLNGTVDASSPTGLRNMAADRANSDGIPLIQVNSIESPLPDRLSPIASLDDLLEPVSSKQSSALADLLETSFTVTDIYIDLPSDAAFKNARSYGQDASHSPTKADQVNVAKSGDKAAANGSKDKPARKVDDAQKSTAKDGAAAGASTAKGLRGSSEAANVSEKRRRDDVESETDSSVKRRKANEGSLPNARSPSRTNAANAKQKLPSTPNKVVKRKVESTPEAGTPQRGARTPPSGASKILASQSRRWKAELSRLEAIGKALKRKSQVKADKSTDRTDRERAAKLATVQGIESALCYMTAFCANDQIKATHQSWRSLSPLLDELIQRTDGHSHLQGLCYLIRAACCSRSVSILNGAKLGDAQDAEKLKEHLVAIQTYVQRADEFAREANKHLTRSVLAEAYPEAYKASDAIPLATPSPMPVVRMAVAFLSEWSQRQGLDWKPLFDEGECAKL